MFAKTDRSSFPYWFAHWCAYQMVALNYKVWKPKYLLHDIEKPWLRLFMSYDKVQAWHRTHAAHHMPHLWDKQKKIDWEAMAIDWECSRFTKEDAPLTAYETLLMYIDKKSDKYDVDKLARHMYPVLYKLGFITADQLPENFNYLTL